MLAVFLLLVGGFALYIILPLFDRNYKNKKVGALPQEERESLQYKKDEVLAALNDLEYDFKMKKMNEPDYLQLKEKLTHEAIEVMKRIDSLDSPSHKNAAASFKPGRQNRRVGS
jgi:hypothetical protein